MNIRPESDGPAVSPTFSAGEERLRHPALRPFCDLSARHEGHFGTLMQAAAEVIHSGRFSHGREVDDLEKMLQHLTGAKGVVSCANGSDALELALRALGIGAGDGVIVPANTFVASASSIMRAGGIPIFADVDPKSGNLSPDGVERALEWSSKRLGAAVTPRAMIAVNIFGLPCEYRELREIARRHNLKIVEDAAQSFGAEYHGVQSGALGDIATFSFFPAKPLGACGDGGAVLCSDEVIAARVRMLANHGLNPETGKYETLGMNSRLDTIQAAFLLVAVEEYQQSKEDRQRIADFYRSSLTHKFDLQALPKHCTSANAQFPIYVRGDTPEQAREALIGSLKNRGFEARAYYRDPLHLQPVFAHYGFQRGDLPVYEEMARRVLHIPIDPSAVGMEEALAIVEVLTA